MRLVNRGEWPRVIFLLGVLAFCIWGIWMGGCAGTAPKHLQLFTSADVLQQEPPEPPLSKDNLAEPQSCYYLCTNAKSTAVRVMPAPEGLYVRVLTRAAGIWNDGPWVYTCMSPWPVDVGSRFDHIDVRPESDAWQRPSFEVMMLSPDARHLHLKFDGIDSFVHEFEMVSHLTD